MMYNDKDRPELARGSQDVEKPPKRSEETVQFTGRGAPPSLIRLAAGAYKELTVN